MIPRLRSVGGYDFMPCEEGQEQQLDHSSTSRDTPVYSNTRCEFFVASSVEARLVRPVNVTSSVI